MLSSSKIAKKLTWFTKGLRPLSYLLWCGGMLREKETDLIYEGIATHHHTAPLWAASWKETDLIYEGIATFMKLLVSFLPLPERNWPDLRRDCDLSIGHPNPPVIQKETDLIYEGIATHWGHRAYPAERCRKETDLIYEGIATHGLYRWAVRFHSKETDLIYEGIATSLHLSFSFGILFKETDLIYEGIAT